MTELLKPHFFVRSNKLEGEGFLVVFDLITSVSAHDLECEIARIEG